MLEEVERASCSWTLRLERMWSPSTAICRLVNSGVLMVCHVVGRWGDIRPFFWGFWWSNRGRQSREEAGSVGWVHVEVRDQCKAQWLFLCSPLSCETLNLFWHRTAVTHSAMVVPAADRWPRALSRIHYSFFLEMQNNTVYVKFITRLWTDYPAGFCPKINKIGVFVLLFGF